MVKTKSSTVPVVRYGIEQFRAADALENAGGGGPDITEYFGDKSAQYFHRPFRNRSDWQLQRLVKLLLSNAVLMSI